MVGNNPVQLTLRGLDPRTAFEWNQEDIYKFFDNICDGQNGYTKPDDEIVKELREIVLQLRRLSVKPKTGGWPDDTRDFKDPEAKPDQHIYRIVINEALDTVNNSRFSVRLDYRHLGFSYWNPYDLLGAFLSLLGPVTGADRDNFFIPLLAMYVKWCDKIAGKHVGGVGTLPGMFQISWMRIRDNRSTNYYFFLGCSLSGGFKQTNVQPEVGHFRERIALARFGLIKKDTQFRGGMEQSGYDFYNPPSRQNARNPPAAMGLASNKFGNCAETYGFLNITRIHGVLTPSLKGSDPAKTAYCGLALSRELVENAKFDDFNKKWRDYFNIPCDTCEKLIQYRGWRLSNFDLPRA